MHPTESVPAIALRPLQPEDADCLCATVRESLPELSRWLAWAKPDYGYADAEAWIASCTQSRSDQSAYVFGIFETATGALLGSVGLNRQDTERRSANLGYWVATSARGRGVATAAAREAAKFGFGQLGLQRIDILILPDNIASQRVAEKLGATREGIVGHRIFLHDRPRDAMLYSLMPQYFGNARGASVT